MTSDRDRPAESIEATAYSKVDGVETWDLTGQPSDEAFGIEGDSTAVYETQEPRAVRIVLEGRTVETDTDLVNFRRGGSGDYTFLVSTPQMKADPVIAEFRDVLGQLGLDEAPADDFAQQVAAAPADQSKVITAGSGDEMAVLGGWSVAPSTTFTPLAGLGRVILSGITPKG